jgi:glutamyl/glutaminyl-tRNA synthetase
MSETAVITRFAPSPTGYLHVGGARTALFSWLLARHFGGQFLLRIEDTDLARSTQQSVDTLLEDLQWLGLQRDNAELMYQSKRQHVYNTIIDDLMSRDLAYKAYETPEELDAMRKTAEREKRAFIYRRRTLSDSEIQKYQSENRPHVVRFVMPVKEYRFNDVVLGKEIVQPANESQDFVIRKADGMPTYHFGVVVDDAEMKITHVLRGQEHLKNTFYHIALQEALNLPRPIYGHLPVILNIDGSKMGKRDRDKKVRQQTHNWMKNTKKTIADVAAASSLAPSRLQEWIESDTKQLDLDEQKLVMKVVGLKEVDMPEILVHDFRKNGYLPEVLLNFLALLGWNPGGDREQMSLKEMVELFKLEDVGSSNAKFGRDKLLAFNTDACAKAPPERLIAAMKDYLSVNPDSPLKKATDEQLAKVLQMKAGFRTLRQVDEASGFLFIDDDKIEYDPAAIDKVLLKQDKQGAKALQDLAGLFSGAAEWSAHALETTVQQYCEQKQLALGKVAQPIRVAISGSTVSPPIFQSLEMLGKASTITRLNRCLAIVSSK